MGALSFRLPCWPWDEALTFLLPSKRRLAARGPEVAMTTQLPSRPESLVPLHLCPGNLRPPFPNRGEASGWLPGLGRRGVEWGRLAVATRPTQGEEGTDAPSSLPLRMAQTPWALEPPMSLFPLETKLGEPRREARTGRETEGL